MTTFQAIILAIIEGLTEFLPVSSTGHMVLMSGIFGIEKDEFTQLFTVAIQLGAIMAVVATYWQKFVDFKNWAFYIKLMIAVVPALIFGLLFDDKIEEYLGDPKAIAIILILGGIVLIFADNWFKNSTMNDEKEIDNLRAGKIGLYQCLAVMFPGLSRSAATILGGMQQGLTRQAAAEFSFFLAVPTMAAATGYKLLKYYLKNDGFSTMEIQTLAIGNIVAFIVAIYAIRSFVSFLTRNGFRIFGYYRIVIGVLFLIYLYVR